MKILLLNPNTTEVMTERLLACAQQTFGAAAQFDAITATRGVAVIASRASYTIAAQSALEAWASYQKPVDAIVVGCFGDPGVAALREITDLPVYGLAETTMRAMSLAGSRFAVVTAGPRWKVMLDEFALTWQIGVAYGGTHAIDTTGLAALDDQIGFVTLLQRAIEAAHAQGAETIILGGAALAGTAARYQTPARLIDCVETTLEVVLNHRDAFFPTSQTTRLPVANRGLDPNLCRLLASDGAA